MKFESGNFSQEILVRKFNSGNLSWEMLVRNFLSGNLSHPNQLTDQLTWSGIKLFQEAKNLLG